MSSSLHVTAIVAAAGAGRRLGAPVPKQLLEIGGRSILERSVTAFVTHPRVREVIVVLPAALAADPPESLRGVSSVRTVAGGERRQDSVARAFRAADPAADIVLIHDAARPFVTADLISRAIDAAAEHGAAIVAQPVRDTVKRVRAAGPAVQVVETLPRESIFLAQTPQAFRRGVLAEAIALGEGGVEATDEASLAERSGHAVYVVEGTAGNVKITTADDLAAAQRRVEADAPASAVARVGTGYDLHRLVEGRRLVLGGVVVPFERGALGHSDADVVCHAATDAILGAASLSGKCLPMSPRDAAWKDASSVELLGRAVRLAAAAGFRVVNLDVVVILERPKIAPFIDDIRERLAGALGISAGCVSVKGKTNEGVDAVGRGEAVAAHAVALLAAR